MSDEETAADERLGPLLEYFAERSNRIFSYYLCVLEFEGDQNADQDPTKNDRSWALRTIRNACLHESLIAIRDLDDFLKARKSKSHADDLNASEFGYPTASNFLNPSERELIHKLVVHSTVTGAAAQDFRWDIWELTCKCVAQCIEFLRWIESRYGPSHFLLFTAALGCRTKTQKIHGYIAAEIAKRKNGNGGHSEHSAAP